MFGPLYELIFKSYLNMYVGLIMLMHETVYQSKKIYFNECNYYFDQYFLVTIAKDLLYMFAW